MYRTAALSLVFLLLSSAPGLGESEPDSEPRISVEGLLADLEIAREAYETLHPGLYRYNTPEQIRTRFDALAARFAEGLTLRETYLAFSELLAAIRCGHTYANFWNQSDEVQKHLFEGADKVPFTFRILGDRLVVTHGAVEDTRVLAGTQITAINGVSTGNLIAHLMKYVHADGSSDHQRRFDLQVTGVGEYEIFDVFQPLLYPPVEGSYRFSAISIEPKGAFEFSARAVIREERREIIEGRGGSLATSPDELWEFEILEGGIAYLKPGSFVTWKMEMDWRGFLDEAFASVRESEIENLIVDIRGNSGGDDEVLAMLLENLLPEPVTLPVIQELVRYETVPEHLAPHLDTWDSSFRDRTDTVRKIDDQWYTWKDASAEPSIIPGSPGAFAGRVYLLVDPSNSSATFNLARILKDSGRATLVGQTTGGNRRGINGGQMFFLRLPNSGLEMDIPLIGYFPTEEQPDGAVIPDTQVPVSAEQIARGEDAVLEATLRLIAE